jgi:NAD+ kinase
MTELNVDEAEDKLSALLEGNGWIDERSLLQAEVSSGAPDNNTYYALNDVVLARGAEARVIYVEAIIDGELLTTYKADGVIVATATGSTGYALAAGGPVLHPQAKDLLLLPITPHISSGYSLVLQPGSEIKLRLGMTNQAIMSIDGHINLPVPEGSVITVKHSPNTVRFLRMHPQRSFYGYLEQRLKGKG